MLEIKIEGWLYSLIKKKKRKKKEENPSTTTKI